MNLKYRNNKTLKKYAFMCLFMLLSQAFITTSSYADTVSIASINDALEEIDEAFLEKDVELLSEYYLDTTDFSSIKFIGGRFATTQQSVEERLTTLEETFNFKNTKILSRTVSGKNINIDGDWARVALTAELEFEVDNMTFVRKERFEYVFGSPEGEMFIYQEIVTLQSITEKSTEN